MPSCGEYCKIEYSSKPLLIRKTHKKCNNCENMVSFNYHNKCYKCAEYNTKEFLYHHEKCIISSININY